jgi:hypothetical protein
MAVFFAGFSRNGPTRRSAPKVGPVDDALYFPSSIIFLNKRICSFGFFGRGNFTFFRQAEVRRGKYINPIAAPIFRALFSA